MRGTGSAMSSDVDVIIAILRSSNMGSDVQSLVNRCWVAADELDDLRRENAELRDQLGGR